MGFLIQLLIIAILIGGGFLIGTFREQRHLRELTEREGATAHVVVTDLRTPPPGFAMTTGAMVLGEVVVASDYYKQVAAQLRSIVGGEVGVFRNVMDRGRREARLRMVEQAAAMGSTTIINVRFETSTIAQNGVEVLCYGTALR